jgi:hypothetical protein
MSPVRSPRFPSAFVSTILRRDARTGSYTSRATELEQCFHRLMGGPG